MKKVDVLTEMPNKALVTDGINTVWIDTTNIDVNTSIDLEIPVALFDAAFVKYFYSKWCT